MFDFALSELVIVMLVALVVIGPERLPKVARTAGSLWGRMQRYVHSVKSDIANDLAIEEAKQLRKDIGEQLTAVERAAIETRLSLERGILDAQTGKAPATTGEPKTSVAQPSGAQPSDTPDKQA